MKGARDKVNLFRERIGRRGLLLICFGIPYILYGLGDEVGDPYHYVAVQAYDMVDLIDRYHLSWGWIYVGALAVVASLFRPRSLAVEETAYGLLMAPPMFWALSFLVAWFEYGYVNFYTLFVVNGALVLLLLYCARNMTDRA